MAPWSDGFDTTATPYGNDRPYAKPEPRPDHSEALEKRLHCRVGWRAQGRCSPRRAGRARQAHRPRRRGERRARR